MTGRPSLSSPTSVAHALLLPGVLILQCAVIVISPGLFLVAGILCAIQRSSRPWRSVGLVVAFAGIELKAVAQLLRGVDDLDRFVTRVVEHCYQAMRRVLAVPLVLEEGSPTRAEVQRSQGLIVLSRHCGPGDTFYVAWVLAVHYELSLRIVLKNLLRLEPAIGLAADDLPFCFVGGNRDDATEVISTLAADLGPGQALLLFPEGGNFTWARWRTGVRHLHEHGRRRAASRALRRTHTLAPRPGGALAALSSAPHADVLLVAHAGFSRDGRDRKWWRVPIYRDFLVRTMLIPAGHVPRDEIRGRSFLEQAWTQVDTWVEAFDNLHAPIDEPESTPQADGV